MFATTLASAAGPVAQFGARRVRGMSELTLRFACLLALCVLALTACVGISATELSTIGTTSTHEKIDFEVLYAFADRSQTAYEAEDVIRSKFPATTRVADPGTTDGRYFLEVDQKKHTQTITIRGTASKIDIHDDIEVKIREDRQIAIPVHTGFDLTTLAIYADVKPYLRPGYKTYITGHSLGGAVAALLAVYLIEDGHKVVKVITFGQPKFTTAAGVAKLAMLPITRVVDENDIVPMLPPTTLGNREYGTYEHVGPELILLEGPRFAFLQTHDATRISIGELARSMRIAELKDHHMDNYMRRLSAKMKAGVEVPYHDREKYVASSKPQAL